MMSSEPFYPGLVSSTIAGGTSRPNTTISNKIDAIC